MFSLPKRGYNKQFIRMLGGAKHHMKLPYKLWYTKTMPLKRLLLKPAGADNKPRWSMGFLEDIKANGLRNPIVIDGHTSLHDQFVITVGNNRHWAARQLAWETIPAVVSYPRGLDFLRIAPDAVEVTDLPALQALFKDGTAYMNPMGFGVFGAPIPEKTY